jgi:hypothetical protein
MILQCAAPLSNTSDAFIFWVLSAVLFFLWLFVSLPARRAAATQFDPTLPRNT